MPTESFNPDAAINKLAAAVAEILGKGWFVDPNRSWEHGATLTGPNEVSLFLRNTVTNGSELGKVEVSSHYTARMRLLAQNTHTNYEITVSGKKTPEVFARDLMRRILPDVTAETARILDKIAAHEAKRETRHAARDALLAALPPAAQVGHEGDDATRTEVSWHQAGTNESRWRRTEWRLNAAGTEVDVTLTALSLDQALRIAAILTEN